MVNLNRQLKLYHAFLSTTPPLLTQTQIKPEMFEWSRHSFFSFFFLTLGRMRLMFKCVLGRCVQELFESRDGRPGLSILTSLLVSVDVKNY